jgi:hypothetical protein
MTTQAGPEEGSRPDRSELFMALREILLDYYPSKPNMRTVIGDIDPEPAKFITNSEDSEDLWSEALRRIYRAGKLINFLDRICMNVPSNEPSIAALYEFEKNRLEAERVPADRLRDSLRFAPSATLQLQGPKHLDQQSITALQNQIKDLFIVLNDLLKNPESNQNQNLGVAHLIQIRQRAEKCIDILQYYEDLLRLAEQFDDLQDESASHPGHLEAYARDRRVLLQGKAALRKSLARLAEYL